MVETVLKSFIKTIDPELQVKEDSEFFFDFNTNTVHYNLSFEDEYGFMSHINNKHMYQTNLLPITMAFLHEVGHYMSDDEVDSKGDLLNRGLMSLISLKEVKKHTYLQNWYYDLPTEWAATEWAINFVETNHSFCEKLNNFFLEVK